MRRFKFPLETVLRLRRYQEQEARQEFQWALLRLREAEELLGALLEQRVASQERLREQLAQGSPSALLVALWQGLAHLEEMIRQQQQTVAELEAQAETRRQQYVERQRERQTVEKLKEKRWTEYRYEMERLEQQSLDEGATLNYTRRQMHDSQRLAANVAAD
jgi:flagellar FliJ protein